MKTVDKIMFNSKHITGLKHPKKYLGHIYQMLASYKGTERREHVEEVRSYMANILSPAANNMCASRRSRLSLPIIHLEYANDIDKNPNDFYYMHPLEIIIYTKIPLIEIVLYSKKHMKNYDYPYIIIYRDRLISTTANGYDEIISYISNTLKFNQEKAIEYMNRPEGLREEDIKFIEKCNEAGIAIPEAGISVYLTNQKDIALRWDKNSPAL